MANIPDNQIEKIYPSENDLSLIDYDGINSNENNFTNNLRNRNPRNYVLPNVLVDGTDDTIMGFKVTKDTDTTIDIEGGRAYIHGRVVEVVDTYTQLAQTVIDEKDNYVYAKLNITAGKVDNFPSITILIDPVNIEAKPNQVPDSVLLALVRVSGGKITSILDLRNTMYDQPIDRYEQIVTVPQTVNPSFTFGPWRTFPYPTIDELSFRIGGYVGIGLGDFSSNASGTLSWETRIELEGDPNQAVIFSLESGTFNFWISEDNEAIIQMQYLEVGFSLGTRVAATLGQQCRFRIGIRVTGFSISAGSGSANPTAVYMQTVESLIDDTATVITGLSQTAPDAGGSKPAGELRDHLFTNTSATWSVRNTVKEGLTSFIP